MDTKLKSDLESSDLETIIKNLTDLKGLVERQEQHIEDLQAKLEKSEGVLTVAALIEKHDVFVKQAEAEGLSFQDWVVRILHVACQPTNALPIHPEIYRDLKVLADGKGISMREFGEGEDISSVLNEALANYRL